jgi:hypothetical protein
MSAYPDTVGGPHFLKFAHKLFKGVVRDQARVPVRVELDEITKVLHLRIMYVGIIIINVKIRMAKDT